MGPCLCGDPCCPSCGPAQGYCPKCTEADRECTCGDEDTPDIVPDEDWNNPRSWRPHQWRPKNEST